MSSRKQNSETLTTTSEFLGDEDAVNSSASAVTPGFLYNCTEPWHSCILSHHNTPTICCFFCLRLKRMTSLLCSRIPLICFVWKNNNEVAQEKGGELELGKNFRRCQGRFQNFEFLLRLVSFRLPSDNPEQLRVDCTL